MEIFKTFAAGLMFIIIIYILFFIASLGWNEAKELTQMWFELRMVSE